MKDLIEREAAINTIKAYFKKRIDTLPTQITEDGEVCADIKSADKLLEHNKILIGMIKQLPSTQPNLQQSCNQLATDLISRQAAIDALKYNQDVYSHNFHDDPIDKYTTAIIAADIDTLVKLPSAQPEPCGEVVSREVVVEFFNDWMSALDINCHHQSVADLMIIKGDIKNLPSAQPEIVRCKDCKWKQGSECVRFAEVRPFPDDFCSRAERRTDGSDRKTNGN